METNRRDFLQAMGASAVGLGIASALPAAAGQTGKPAPARGKMVIRADDIGQSKVCNIGTFEEIEHGVVTVAAVMLDSPGTEDALERLKAYPWISDQAEQYRAGQLSRRSVRKRRIPEPP